MRRSTPLFLGLGFVLAAAVLDEGTASASGYLTARYGTEHGTPATPNAFAIYYNPAALGGTTGTSITGDFAAAVRWAHYQRGENALSPSTNQRDALLADQKYIDANTGNANLLDVLALPFLGVNTDFGSKNFRAGYAFYIPFGGASSWQKRPEIAGVPGAMDGVQRWQNISGEILAIYNTFAFAYRFGDSGFSAGLSLSPIIHHVSTVRARTADDSDDIYRESDGSLKEGRSLLTATGVNLGGSIGVYYEGLDQQRLKIGLAYLAQPGFGQTRMKGTLDGHTGNNDVRQDIDFLQTYPDVFRLGAKYRLPGDVIELRSDVEFVRWSVFKNQCVVLRGKNCNVEADGTASGGNTDIVLNIPRNWNNAVSWRVGVGWYATKEIEVFGGTAIDTSAVPKETIDASTIDSFRIFGTAGVRYTPSRHFTIAGSYNHIYYLPVDTGDRNIFDKQLPPSHSPSADGKYWSQIGFLNVNASYTF